MRRELRLRGRLLGLLGLSAVLLSGCGIRSTEVPTDFGAAPTRVGCSLSGSDDVTARAGGQFAVQVFLVCTSQLVTVDRTVTLERDQTSDRVGVAQELLAQLAKPLTAEEKQAGYTTDVTSATKVSGPRRGDPADALRLNVPPDDLSPYALAQMVCTFANSKVTTDGGDHVALGGPGGRPAAQLRVLGRGEGPPGAGPGPGRDGGLEPFVVSRSKVTQLIVGPPEPIVPPRASRGSCSATARAARGPSSASVRQGSSSSP